MSVFSDAFLALSPALYLRLGEASGTTAADASGNGRTGTYGGSPTLGVAGSVGGDADTAVTLDGSSQYVTVSDHASLRPGTGDFTLLFAAKTTASGTLVAVAKYPGSGASAYWAGISNGQFKLSVANDSANLDLIDPTPSNDGQWHRYLAVRSATAVRLYRDGQRVASNTVAADFDLSPGGSFAVGRLGDAGIFWFDGSVDEVGYLGTAMSDADAAEDYAAWRGGLVSVPVSVTPRTTGVTLALTRIGAGWDGSTTFAVSGLAGVSKTDQSVADGSHATVTVTTGGTAGDFMVSDGTETATVAVQPYKVVRTTQSGVAIVIVEPVSYDGSTAAPGVAYHHGAAQTAESLLDSPLLSLIERAASLGCVCWGASVGNAWGNPAGLTAHATAHAYVLANYNISRVILMPQSMGGLTAYQAVRDAVRFAEVWGLYAIFPVVGIVRMYDANSLPTGQILTAWGVADRTGLVTAVAPYDPIGLSAAGYPGIHYRVRASPDDTIVEKAEQADAMVALLATRSTRENSSLASTGDHGDPSNYVPDDFDEFLLRVAADVALSLTGPGGPLADGDTDAAGTVPHNSTRLYTLANIGTVDAENVAIDVPAGTTLVAGAPTVVPAGESRQYRVRFSTAGATVNGDMVVTADGVALTVGLTATVGEATAGGGRRGRGRALEFLGL